MLYKVRGFFGTAMKSVEVDRAAPLSEIKTKLEQKFGSSLALSYKRADGTIVSLTSDAVYAAALQDAVASGAKFMRVECASSRPGAPAPASSAPRPAATVSAPAASPARAPAAAAAAAVAAPPPAAAAASSVFCSACGVKFVSGSRFCSGCGASAPGSAPAPASAPASAPAPAPAPAVPRATAPNQCPGCGQVAAGSIVQVLDRNWHAACFVCQGCRNPLSGSFHDIKGMPYCANCYAEQGAEKCAKCRKALVGSCIEANGVLYHAECFVCTGCGSPFQGGYILKNGSPYCRQCAV